MANTATPIVDTTAPDVDTTATSDQGKGTDYQQAMADTNAALAKQDDESTAPEALPTPAVEALPAPDWDELFSTATLESTKGRPARSANVDPAMVERASNAMTKALALKKKVISLPIRPGDDKTIQMLTGAFYAAGDTMVPPVSLVFTTEDNNGATCKADKATFLKVTVGGRRGKRSAPDVVKLADADAVIADLAEAEKEDANDDGKEAGKDE